MKSGIRTKQTGNAYRAIAFNNYEYFAQVFRSKKTCAKYGHVRYLSLPIAIGIREKRRIG